MTIFLFLFSCMKFASPNFQSTNSPCLDAILTNIDYNCKEFHFGEDEDLGKIRCIVPRKNNYNFWTSVEFIVFPIETELIVKNSQVLYCVDPYLFVIAEKK